MARKSNKATPVVIRGVLYTNDGWTGTRLDSPQWSEWLALRQTFYVDAGGFTVRPESRRGHIYWYAVKKIDGRAVKRYMGRSVSAGQLDAAGAELAGRVALS